MRVHKGRSARAALAAAAALLLPATAAEATKFTDPGGDFLASYTGAANAGLDILAGSVRYDESTLYLTTRVSGPISGAPGSFVLWGVNRGAGTARLISSGPPPVGPPTVLLDAVVRLGDNGVGAVVAFPTAGPPTTTFLPAGSITVLGSVLTAAIPRSLLPSTGFAFADYSYISWSRSALGPQGLIADLAPDGASILGSAVPEPASWAMLILGFGTVGLAARRRQRAMAA